MFASFEMDEHILECVDGNQFIYQSTYQLWVFFYYVNILAKKTFSSRSVKDQSLVSRWEMDWLRTWDGRKPS
ncbi:hypothetical protein COC44_22520 [Bacillus cereus]|nr:hypothetical protein COC44_22520 [Bacillus cereus]